jgi:predicted MFS family arabinose efflux permease
MTSVAVALAAGALTLLHLFVAAFAEGTAFIFMHVCQPGALRRIVPAEQVPDAIARAEAREYGTSLAGPPLGGVLYGLARSLPFSVNAVSYLLSFVSVLLIGTRLVDDAPASREPVLREIREGIRWLWHQPFLRASLLLVGLANFFSDGVSFVLVVVRQHGGSAAVIGTMLAISSVGGLLGAFAAPTLRRLLPRRLVVLSIMWVGAAVSAPLMAVAPHALALGAIVALIAFIGPTWNAVVDGYRISIVPDRLQGRVSSVDALLAFSAIPLAPLVGGVLIEAIGGRATLLAFGALMLAVAVTGTASRGLRIPAEAPARN